MAQRQLQSQQQTTDYRPVATYDNSRAMAAEYDKNTRSDERILQGMRENEAIIVENAKRPGKELEQLGKFSQTLTNFLVEEQQERNENEEAEGINEAFLTFSTDGIDTTQLEEGEAQAERQDQVAQDVASGVLNKDGTNYRASSAFSAPTTWREVGRSKGRLMAAAGTYASFMETELNKLNPQNPTEYAAQRERLRTAYFKQVGVAGTKPEFLAQNFFPKILEADTRQAGAWNKTHNIELSTMRKDELASTFAVDGNLNSYLSAMRNELGPDGSPLNYSGAWDSLETIIPDMVAAGTIDTGEIQRMRFQPVPNDPKGRTFGELYDTRLKKLELSAMSAQQTIFYASQNNRQLAASKRAEQMRAALVDPNDPDGFTDANYRKAVATYKEEFPGMPIPTNLSNLAGASVEGKARDKQREQLKDLQAMGLLHTVDMQAYDPTLQAEFASQHKASTELADVNGNYKKQEEVIDAMVEKGNDKLTNSYAITDIPVGKNDPSVLLMQMQMKSLFFENLAAANLTGSETPAQDAMNATRVYFDQNITSGAKGYQSMVPNAADVLAKSNAAKAKITEVNAALKKSNALQTEGAILDTPTLEENEKGYGKPGWTPPPSAVYAGKVLGVNPLTVIKAQREAAGLKPLPESPAEMATDNLMTEHQKRVLTRYTAPVMTNVAHNNRALGVTQQFVPEVVPNGYGKYIAESGAKYGVNPTYIAALAEIESGFNPNAPSYNNSSFGVMQINRSAHPAFFAEQNWKDPQTNIDYGSEYYSKQLQRFGDPIAAAMAYNAGPEDYQRYLDGTLPDGPKKREMIAHGEKFKKAMYKYGGGREALKSNERNGMRSPTGALTYENDKESYMNAGNLFQRIGFKVGEHSSFGGTAPVHSSSSYHNYDEAFDITHWNGERDFSISETRRLKESVKQLGLFKEVLGPGDAGHDTHLHVGGLLRAIRPEDEEELMRLFGPPK
jgi:hypothetical protein